MSLAGARRWGGGLVAAVLVLFATPAFAEGISAADAVAVTLASASETQAAEQRVSDQTIRDLRRRLDRLQARYAADHSALRELTAAREELVTELARRDSQFARFISEFRSSVETIAETPEGRELLARRHPGNLAEIRGLLIEMEDRREAAIQQRSNIEHAARRRALAAIALDDRGHGEATNAEVIVLFEEVTRLDPGVAWDWISLAQLYLVVGNIPAARDAANHAETVATSDDQHGLARLVGASIEQRAGDFAAARSSFEAALVLLPQPESRVTALLGLGDVLFSQNDLERSRQRYEEVAAICREHAAPDVLSSFYESTLAIAVDRIGRVLDEQGDTAGGRARHEESLAIYRRLLAADPSDVSVQLHMSETLVTQGQSLTVPGGDLVGGLALLDEALRIQREHAQRGDSYTQMLLSDTLVWRGLALALNREPARALESLEESLTIGRRLDAAMPGTIRVRQNISQGLRIMGIILYNQHDLDGARSRLEEALVIDRELAARDAHSVSSQHTLAEALRDLARVLEAQGDSAGARARLTEADAIDRAAGIEPEAAP